MSNQLETYQCGEHRSRWLESEQYLKNRIARHSSSASITAGSAVNHVNLVLKDYDQSEDSGSAKVYDNEQDDEDNDDLVSNSVEEQLKHIEDTAKKSLSKYFEKNVLKFKIKLTFEEPLHLTNDIYLDEISMKNSDPDRGSVCEEGVDVASSDQEDENESDVADSNVKLGLISLENDIRSNDFKNDVNFFNKLSNIVDQFIGDEEAALNDHDQVENPDEDYKLDMLSESGIKLVDVDKTEQHVIEIKHQTPEAAVKLDRIEYGVNMKCIESLDKVINSLIVEPNELNGGTTLVGKEVLTFDDLYAKSAKPQKDSEFLDKLNDIIEVFIKN